VGVPLVCAHYRILTQGGERAEKVRGKWVEQLRALKELSLVRFRVDPLRELCCILTVLVEWAGHFKKVRGK
jgi:hypothetical protein